MTTQTQNNGTQLDLDIVAQQAGKAWESGAKATAKGTGLAIFVLFQSWHTRVFSAIIKGTKDEDDKRDNFSLADYCNNVRATNEKGEVSKKITAARKMAILSDLFALTEPTLAQQQGFVRALDIAHNMIKRGLLPSQVEVNANTGKLSVPYTLMFEAPGEKASTNERKAYDRAKDDLHELDGKRGSDLKSLASRVAPPTNRAPQNKTTDNNKTASFKASVDYVTMVLAAINDPNGDNKGADDINGVNEELKAKMWKLQQQLVAYFKEDPVDEVKDKAPRRRTA